MIKIHITGGDNMKKQGKLDSIKGFKTLTKEEKRKTVGGATSISGTLASIFDKYFKS